MKTHSFALTRRAFLQTTTFWLGWGAVSGSAWSQNGSRSSVAVILSNLGRTLSAEDLNAILGPLFANLIPVGLVLPGANEDLAETIFALADKRPGLVEPLLEIPRDALDGQGSFDPAVEAANAAAHFKEAARPYGGFKPLSLFLNEPNEAWRSVAGLRSVGARSVFVRGTTGDKARRQTTEDNVEWLANGVALYASEPFATWRDAILSATEGPEAAVFHVSLGDAALEDAVARLSGVAALLKDLRDQGRFNSLLPKELFYRDDQGRFAQSALLLLEQSAAPNAEQDAMAEFSAQLTEAGFAFGVVHTAPISRMERDRFDCVVAGTGDQSERDRFILVKDANAGPIDATLALWPPSDAAPDFGMDATGTLNLPIGAEVNAVATRNLLREAFARTGGVFSDQVILIRAQAIGSELARSVMLDAIRQLHAFDLIAFKSLPGFLETLYPGIWTVDRAHEAQVFHSTPRAYDPAQFSSSRETLMADAGLAWAYFTRAENAATGLSAPTRYVSPGYTTVNRTITLWDVGSTLQAVISAIELGLEDRDKGIDRIERIVNAIPTRNVLGLTLPVAEMTFSSFETFNRDFNGCDVGRLLVALKRAARIEELRETIEATVGGWDLSETLGSTGPIDIKNGKIIRTPFNHCSAYAVEGYRLWGLVAEPFSGGLEQSWSDKVRQLETTDNLSPLGMEPYALRALEVGASGDTDLLIDALVSAETEAFREEGIYYALSETPLDREPWFSYQGLDVSGRPVTFAAQSQPVPGGVVEVAGADQLVLGAKAAYLGVALRPAPFTQARLERVRDLCGQETHGFIVGSYAKTGAPMTGYSDANTNGIILEAADYILNGRKPLLSH